VPLAFSLSARVNAEVRSQARGQAQVVAALAGSLLGQAVNDGKPTENEQELQVLADAAAPSVRGRVIVVGRTGVVLADSAGPTYLGSNYATSGRPEIVSALGGKGSQGERPSASVGQTLLLTALPVLGSRGQVLGAVRVSQLVSAVHSAVRTTILQLGLVALVVLALGLTMGTFIAGQIARPLRRLERVARRIAGGDLSARAAVEGSLEQRSLGTSFNEMTDRVERLVASQRNFVADASHQLRTPLTGLRLRLEEARAVGVSDAAARELDAAEAEVDRFADIIDELLVLSRAGERELPGEAISLDELAADALARWWRTAEERRIELRHVRDGSAGTVWCARADAERALDVLVENALAYAPSGSIVTITALASAVEVLDSGPGLGEDETEVVFERFHRGRAGAAGAPGSGLGLAIARELAREWGGDVTLRNRPQGGAIATLRLRQAP